MATTEIAKTDYEKNYVELTKTHLAIRCSNNPEFEQKFLKTFSDLIYSQSDEMREKLEKTRPNSLLNAVFRATELGASFAKKEIHFIPYEIKKKEKNGEVERTISTGEYEATIIPDINFQKQLILKMPNCKHFFSAEVHEGVTIIHDLTTGNRIFIGENDVIKPTIGYYARFLATDGEVYDEFMTCAEIVDRARANKVSFKEENYKNTRNSPHYEKIVIRNLMKGIPKVSDEIKSVLSWESGADVEITEHEDVTDKQNALEAAKKELAEQAVTIQETTVPDSENSEPEKIEEYL